jgi:CheY-like chemotaxis protein
MEENRVLVVDDESLIRWGLSKGFSTHGYTVDTAIDCATARQWINGKPFPLCFVSIHLPDGNGLDLVEWIRRESPETRIVVLSGDGSEENKRRAFELGVYQFIDKPFEMTVITHLMADVFSDRPERRARVRHLCRLGLRVSAVADDARESPLDLHHVGCESIDFSREGIGLLTGYPLRVGQELRVEVLRGRCACADFVRPGSRARVMWTLPDPAGCRAGLRLESPAIPDRTS